MGLNFSNNDLHGVDGKLNFSWQDSVGNAVSTRAQKAVKQYEKESLQAIASLDELQKEVSYIFGRLRDIDTTLEFIR